MIKKFLVIIVVVTFFAPCSYASLTPQQKLIFANRRLILAAFDGDSSAIIHAVKTLKADINTRHAYAIAKEFENFNLPPWQRTPSKIMIYEEKIHKPTALMIAALKGNLTLVEELVFLGALLEIKDEDQRTALQIAALIAESYNSQKHRIVADFLAQKSKCSY